MSMNKSTALGQEMGPTRVFQWGIGLKREFDSNVG
jgi:hypothetical protein